MQPANLHLAKVQYFNPFVKSLPQKKYFLFLHRHSTRPETITVGKHFHYVIAGSEGSARSRPVYAHRQLAVVIFHRTRHGATNLLAVVAERTAVAQQRPFRTEYAHIECLLAGSRSIVGTYRKAHSQTGGLGYVFLVFILAVVCRKAQTGDIELTRKLYRLRQFLIGGRGLLHLLVETLVALLGGGKLVTQAFVLLTQPSYLFQIMLHYTSERTYLRLKLRYTALRGRLVAFAPATLFLQLGHKLLYAFARFVVLLHQRVVFQKHSLILILTEIGLKLRKLTVEIALLNSYLETVGLKPCLTGIVLRTIVAGDQQDDKHYKTDAEQYACNDNDSYFLIHLKRGMEFFIVKFICKVNLFPLNFHYLCAATTYFIPPMRHTAIKTLYKECSAPDNRKTKIPALIYRKWLRICLCCLLTVYGSRGMTASGAWPGAGTPSDPYRISTSAQLDSLRALPDGGNGAFFRLDADIIADSTFRPIPLFAGTLDGAGHYISYHFTAPADSIALFNLLQSSATVRNLELRGSVGANSCVAALSVRCNGTLSKIINTMTVTADGMRSGGLVIEAGPESVIDSCINRGTVTGMQGWTAGIAVTGMGRISRCRNQGNLYSASHAGGIVSRIYGAATIYRCSNDADIILPDADNVAGIAAYSSITLSGFIRDCSNNARITAMQYAGGIAGRLESGLRLDSCVNNGVVSAIDRYAGGITGLVDGSPTDSTVISHCRNLGEVRGEGQYTGGIAGFSYSNVRVRDCYNRGAINATGSAAAYTGGICGMSMGMIRHCGNEAPVTALSGYATGGIAGATENGFQCMGCYNLGAITGGAAPARGERGIAGGLSGDSRQSAFYNCYNTGRVTADEAVGGITGITHDNCHFSGCYNAAVITAHASGTAPVAAITSYAPDATPSTITASALYFDAQLCYRLSEFDMRHATPLSTEQLCSTPPTAAFDTAGWCYPVLSSATVEALLQSVCIGYTSLNDNADNINHNIYTGLRPGMKWSINKCFERIGEYELKPIKTGTSTITVTDIATGASRPFTLTVVSYNNACRTAADAIGYEWHTLAGIPVANPSPGNLYVRVTIYSDGSRKAETVLIRP